MHQQDIHMMVLQEMVRPIENIGPAADLVVQVLQLRSKTDDTYDFGTSTIQWKDGFLMVTKNRLTCR